MDRFDDFYEETEKDEEKENIGTRLTKKAKTVLLAVGLTVLLILVIIAACFIAYGAGVAPEPVNYVIVQMEESLSSAGIHVPFIGTTGGAVTEPAVHEPITTPYVRPGTTSEGALDADGNPIGISGAAVTGSAVTEEAINEPEPELEPEPQIVGDASGLYPEMKVSRPAKQVSTTNVVYLTFDDGPCSVTEDVLDTLKEHDVKATFFLVGNRLTEATRPIVDRIVNEGHAIGVHTTSHKYKPIYASVDAYLEDFHTTYELIHDMTGQYPKIFRFPGGSINSYNANTHTAIINEMTKRGFTYYDWNVSAGDAASNPTEEGILINATRGVKYFGVQKNVIVLMHDTSSLTASQLGGIIETYETAGFTFDALSPGIKPIIF